MEPAFCVQGEDTAQLPIPLLVPPEVSPPVEKGHFLQGSLGQEIRVIRHKEDSPLHFAVFIGGDPVHPNLPAVGPVDPGQGPQQGGFPRPVGAHQAEHRTGLHLQADAVQGGFLPKPFDKLLYCDHTLPPPFSGPPRPNLAPSRAQSRISSSGTPHSEACRAASRREVFAVSCRRCSACSPEAKNEPFPA